MLARMSSRTRLSQPGRAVSGRFLQTSQTDEARADEARARVLLTISVWIGQLASTTKPARMIAETSVSQASGCLWAKMTTNRPSASSAALQAENVRYMPSSYTAFDLARSQPWRD